MNIGAEVGVGGTTLTVARFLQLAVGPNQNSTIAVDQYGAMCAVIRGKGPDVIFVSTGQPRAPYEDMDGDRMFDTPDAMALRPKFDIRRDRGVVQLDKKTVWWAMSRLLTTRRLMAKSYGRLGRTLVS